MFVYSPRILRFVEEVREIIKKVLSQEMRLLVSGDRFWTREHDVSYPIAITVYTDRKMMAYFCPNFLEIGFHERLMHVSRQQLFQVIRHELAHYYAFILFGKGISPHGQEFLSVCKQMRWEEEVTRATMCLDSEGDAREESVVLRKVQKLLALASSSNQHEAEAAMIKSQQLLLKHNLEACPLEEGDDRVYMKRVLERKRRDSKMSAIGRILKTFFVDTVYSRGQESATLEVIGTLVNVEIADYVAEVLDHQLDKLWDQARRERGFKGVQAKNSFYWGVAKGYVDKIERLKRSYAPDVSSSLVVIEKKLQEALRLVHPRLGTLKFQSGFCAASGALGEKIGRELTIHTPLAQASSSGRFLA